MGDGKGGGADPAGGLHDQVVDYVGHDRVQAGGRFVEENDFRVGGDGARQRHALQHAAGKLGGIKIADLGAESDLGQLGGGDLFCLVAVDTLLREKAERDVFPDGQAVEQRRALEQHAEFLVDAFPIPCRNADHLFAVDLDAAARVRRQETEHAFDQDRFAGARTADDDQRFADAHVQIDAVQHDLRTEGFL